MVFIDIPLGASLCNLGLRGDIELMQDEMGT